MLAQMNVISPVRGTSAPHSFALPKRSIEEVLAPLNRLASVCANFIPNPEPFEPAAYALPRYIFVGPRGGGDPIRIGLFAGIHGDEPEGIHALSRLLGLLAKEPDVSRGYHLVAYPICNPTGFEDRTRAARSGKDLNREFWRRSSEPEVRWLEGELRHQNFDGLISLHTDDTSGGFYGFAHGATITRNIIGPALEAASEFLPINAAPIIDGFPAENGMIRAGYKGVLRSPPGARPRPFEIILETPHAAPNYLKEAALIVATTRIITEYRQFIAYASNL
jgi:hypothetical protein